VTVPPFFKGRLGGIKKRIKMKPYNKNLKQASRDLRNSMTDAEKLLWIFFDQSKMN
jgi:very-short-patch-repair endonuclease